MLNCFHLRRTKCVAVYCNMLRRVAPVSVCGAPSLVQYFTECSSMLQRVAPVSVCGVPNTNQEGRVQYHVRSLCSFFPLVFRVRGRVRTCVVSHRASMRSETAAELAGKSLWNSCLQCVCAFVFVCVCLCLCIGVCVCLCVCERCVPVCG